MRAPAFSLPHRLTTPCDPLTLSQEGYTPEFAETVARWQARLLARPLAVSSPDSVQPG